MKRPHPKGFYVYALVDPRDSRPFYIGKGKGRRMYTHARRARRMGGDNPRKDERIRALESVGLRVVETVIEEGLSEGGALTLERGLISVLGSAKLTNAAPGAFPWWERMEARARALAERLKPFDVWVRERKPSEFNMEIYCGIRTALADILSGRYRHLPEGIAIG